MRSGVHYTFTYTPPWITGDQSANSLITYVPSLYLGMAYHPGHYFYKKTYTCTFRSVPEISGNYQFKH